MKPPIYDMLIKYISKQRIKFNSPGHKGKIRMKTDNLCRIDIRDGTGVASGYELDNAIRKSEDEISGIFGASRSYYLNSGISAGIYASLASVLSPGDKVIVDPDCDKAIINAITILALQPVFLKRSYWAKYSVNGGINAEKLEHKMLQANAKVIIVSSPNYYGICANIKKIVSLAHEMNMLVMVDESYGAHFYFAKEAPETALDCGADIVIHATDKTLGGFGGSGLLHLAESVDESTKNAIEANLDIYQGDAKSSAFTCALENVLHYAFTESHKYHILYKEIERSKFVIETKTNIMWLSAEENNGCDIADFDACKIVLNFSKYDSYAKDVSDILIKRYAIESDYADEENIVFSVSIYNSATEIRRLVNAILSISKLLVPMEANSEDEEDEEELFDEGPRAIMNPYKAFYSGSEWVELDASIGKICRKPVCKMPQGTAIIIPGEKINEDMIIAIKHLLECGVRIHGLNSMNQIEVLTLSDSFYF